MLPQKRMECFRLLFDHLAWIEHQFLSGIRDSRKARSLWGIMRGKGGVRKSIHQNTPMPMNVFYLFFLVCVNYFLCAFLSFWALALVGFLLLHKDAVFTLSHFLLTNSLSLGTLCLALIFLGYHSTAASKWTLTKYSYSSLGVIFSDNSWRASDLFLSFIMK